MYPVLVRLMDEAIRVDCEVVAHESSVHRRGYA